jgi:hypothetical protein
LPRKDLAPHHARQLKGNLQCFVCSKDIHRNERTHMSKAASSFDASRSICRRHRQISRICPCSNVRMCPVPYAVAESKRGRTVRRAIARAERFPSPDQQAASDVVGNTEDRKQLLPERGEDAEYPGYASWCNLPPSMDERSQYGLRWEKPFLIVHIPCIAALRAGNRRGT